MVDTPGRDPRPGAAPAAGSDPGPSSTQPANGSPDSDRLPDAPPALSYPLVRALVTRAQSGNGGELVEAGRAWISALPADDPRQFWFRFVSFAAIQAEPALGNEEAVAEALVDCAVRLHDAALESIARAARAIVGGTKGRAANAVIDLAKATVLLDSVTPVPRDRDFARGVAATALNTLAQGLMRNGLNDHARYRLRMLREMADDPALVGLRFVTDGNIGWTYLGEALELLIEDRAVDAEKTFRRARSAFDAAVADAHPQFASPVMVRAISALGLAMGVLGGDDELLDELGGVLEDGEYLRPEHRAVVLLALGRGMRLRSRTVEAVAALEQARSLLLPDRSFRSISALVMTESIAVVTDGRDPDPAGSAHQQMLRVLLQERQGELASRYTAYEEALAHELQYAEHSQLSHLASVDVLTGVHNRRVLERDMASLLSEMRSSGGDGALVFIDLDEFKQINDRHTHLVGDEVLRQLGRSLRSAMHPGDLVMRYGGDEFVMVFHRRSPVAAGLALDAAAAEFAAATARILGTEIGCTFTRGVVAVDAASTVEALIESADRMMLEQKLDRPAPSE
ncbi:MAG: GGDEF domain-containing protein [Nakamurella sp.]